MASRKDRAGAPPISVVVPCLNAVSFIDACLRSILDQRVDGLELIVVDGGSADGSVELIRQHAEHIAWWCSESDAGPASAVRKGLARATSEVVAVLNADDLYLPGALDTALEAMANGADWAVGQVEFVDEQGKCWPVHQEPHARWTEWLLTVPVCQPGSFWRRSIIERAGPLDAAVRWLWDYDLALRLYFDLGLRPRLLDRCVALYRLHAGSATVSRRGELMDEARRLRRRRRSRLTTLGQARLRLAWHQRRQRILLGHAWQASGPRARLWRALATLPGLATLAVDSEAWRRLVRGRPGLRQTSPGAHVFDELDPW